MAEVARAAGASKSVRGHARLYEARLSLELEDPDRARQAVDELLREHSGSTAPDSEWLVERANEYVRKLESRR
jgi:hypothetical protein